MIEGKIAQANGRLKASKVGVTIGMKGDRLFLRTTFPPKPTSKKIQPSQQRLFLGIHTNPTGVSIAEKEARKIGALLDCHQFDWTPYLKTPQTQPETIGHWIEKFKAYFFQCGKSESLWDGDYWKILKRLPPDQPLTAEFLEPVVLGTDPNTKTRQRACMAIGALAKFAKLDYDPSCYAGNYSPKQVSARDLPDDQQITEWFYKIKNPAWRWVYGMMATYGLRNHEVFKLDWERLRQGDYVASVLENTKTGSRRVWCCYPEWFKEFRLSDVQLPRIDLTRSNEKIGHSVTEYFGDFGLPFVPYDLRHCWAIRTLEFGLDISLAAQQMGHSVEVHTRIYHRWITDKHHQRAFETLMMRSDRPKPPSVVQEK